MGGSGWQEEPPHDGIVQSSQGDNQLSVQLPEDIKPRGEISNLWS